MTAFAESEYMQCRVNKMTSVLFLKYYSEINQSDLAWRKMSTSGPTPSGTISVRDVQPNGNAMADNNVSMIDTTIPSG